MLFMNKSSSILNWMFAGFMVPLLAVSARPVSYSDDDDNEHSQFPRIPPIPLLPSSEEYHRLDTTKFHLIFAFSILGAVCGLTILAYGYLRLFKTVPQHDDYAEKEAEP